MLIPALAIFFASGVAALVYQVTWQRMLVIFSGTDVHSATIVVAAFMAGLGCGSLGGGQIADRLSRRTSIALFAAAELAIAAFGLFSPTFFYTILYERAGQVNVGRGATAVVLLFALIWPTFLMGVSLPLLARGLTNDVRRAAATVGALYAANTLGASIGAFGTIFLLLPQAGMAGSVRVAALLNLACAAAAVALALTGRGRPAVPAAVPKPAMTPVAEGTTGLSFLTWAALFAGSGFIALSLEIVWFRMLGVMLKSTSFTFGTLLAIYLAGIGLGAAAGSACAARIRRPALGFFVLQAGSGLYAVLSLTLLVAGLGRFEWLQGLASYFSAPDAIDIRAVVTHIRNAAGAPSLDAGAGLPDFFRLYVLLPAGLIGPPTFMMGFGFPLLQRAVHTDLAHIGRRVGSLVAANILGSTLGAFVTGWVLLDFLGTPATLRLLFILSAGFGALALREFTMLTSRRRRVAVYAGGAVVVASVILAMPGPQRLWASLHGTVPSRIIVAEDGSGLSVLKAERSDFHRVVVYVNGIGQSWIPYGTIHTVLGALPAFAHPNPRNAVVIGLGSGDTLFALAGRPDLERVTSIEIIAPQLTTLHELVRITGYPGVVAITGDSRIEHVFGDGRLYLRRAGRKYDIIEADALFPTSAYSGNLYSDAYFRLLQNHLNPGGLAVTWAPTDRVARTFASVFPYVWHQQAILMGSDAPIDVNAEAILERLRRQNVRDYFATSGVDIESLLGPYLARPWRSDGRSPVGATVGNVNTDLYPRDEFDIPPLVTLPGLQ
jgi:spermidine synthase